MCLANIVVVSFICGEEAFSGGSHKCEEAILQTVPLDVLLAHNIQGVENNFLV